MSFDVELLVTFRCSAYHGVAALARRRLPHVRELAKQRRCPEAVAFLEELAGREGNTDRGPKNGLVAWTYGGNNTRPDEFAETLRPFWDELLRYPVDGGPLRFNHILVLYQLQDSEHAAGREIYLDLPDDALASSEELTIWPLVIRPHPRLPFHW
jgi:hypothetical protein